MTEPDPPEQPPVVLRPRTVGQGRTGAPSSPGQGSEPTAGATPPGAGAADGQPEEDPYADLFIGEDEELPPHDKARRDDADDGEEKVALVPVGQSTELEPLPDLDSPSASRMARANLAVATGTLLSRVTGLARTVLLFATLAPSLRDAFVLANNTPNIIYELILGGVLTATLVPLFTEFVTTDDDESTSAVVSAAVTALVALTVFALVVSPLLMLLYGTNTPSDVSRDRFLAVGIRLAILFAPQIFFYGLMAIGSALLNSRRRYFAAAWAPVLNNLIVIAILFLVARIGQRPSLGELAGRPSLLLLLGLGTTAGIVTMAVALFPALRRAGVPLHWNLQLGHPAVRRAMVLSGWTIGYVVVNQVAGQVINILTKPGSGGTSNYQLAYQFFQLPHGLLAVSLMTTYQPELSRAFAKRDEGAFADRLQESLRLLAAVMLPAVLLYIVVPLSTIIPAAHHDPNLNLFAIAGRSLRLGDAAEIARILAAFSAGLLGFSLYLFILRAFYARGDTRTPFYLNVVENTINVILAVLFVGRWGIVGLALSYAVAYSIASILAFSQLLDRIPGFGLRTLLNAVGRLAGAGAVMVGLVMSIGLIVHARGGGRLVFTMILAGIAGLGAYLVSIVAFRVPVLDDAVRALPDRLSRKNRGVRGR